MKCIDCQFCVTRDQPPRKGLCWKDKEGTRKQKDVHVDRKCDDYALGAMDQLRIREGWKP